MAGKHFIFDDDGKLKEVRGYTDDLCTERWEVVYDSDERVVGIRPLDPLEIVPQSWMDRLKRLWKKPQPLSRILSVDFIGMIQYIGTIHKIKTIEVIEEVHIKSTKGLEGRRYISSSATVTAGADVTIFDISAKSVSLQSLTLTSDSRTQIAVILAPYKEDGTLDGSLAIYDATFSPLYYRFVTIENVDSYKSDVFEVLLDDTVNNNYKVGIKKQLSFPNGLKVYVKNLDAVNSHIGICQALVSVEGE